MRMIVCILTIVKFTWNESKRHANIVKHEADIYYQNAGYF